MDNVIPFDPRLPAPRLVALPFAAIDDDELDLRRWELVMSGRRGSEEYRRLESEAARRQPFARQPAAFR